MNKRYAISLMERLNRAVLAGALFASTSALLAQGTAFTYQGHLQDGGQPANGSYNLRFAIYDAGGAGNLIAGPFTNAATPVANGLFAVTLDFGSAVFTGPARWMELGACTNGSAVFVTLSPRQELTPSPYAIMAGASSNFLGTLPPAGLVGTYSDQLTFNNPLNKLCGDGSCLTGVNAAELNGLNAANFWQLSGNVGTTPGLNFLGTTDDESLVVKVNGGIAVRYDPAPYAPNVIAGLSAIKPTVVFSNVSGAVVAGGGAPSSPVTGNGAGDYFAVYDNDGTIGGGFGNRVGTDNGDATDAAFATVAGGVFNWAAAYGATVAGGDANYSSGGHAAILGGYDNQASGSLSAVCGGMANQALSQASSIGGGTGNVVQVAADYSSIGGGYQNTVQTGAADSSISGGTGNSIQASASFATIGGGVGNEIQGSDWVEFTGDGFAVHTNSFSTIGGGAYNTILTNSDLSIIAGGYGNQIQASSSRSTIGGGEYNMVMTNSEFSTVAGGSGNAINPNCSASSIGGGQDNQMFGASASTIGGGVQNTIWSNSNCTIGGGTAISINSGAQNSTIGGGYINQIWANASDGTIAGGTQNRIQNGQYGTISGGAYNTASGSYATIPGGYYNVASGQGSFAAGTQAQALHQGAFVWADSQSAAFASSANDQVNFRCQGGARFFSNPGATVGVQLLPSGNAWSSISDRNAKKNFQTVDSQAVLEKLAAVPVQRWNYKWEKDSDVPHLGPMAQDFKGAFFPGRDDKSISTMEFDGVELAAIQGLNLKCEAHEAELKRQLAQQLKAKDTVIQSLEQRLERLEQRLDGK